MNTEEAIKILSAWAKCKYKPTHDAACLTVDAIRSQAEAEKNVALTLEELQEIDGEPVWATQMNGAKGLWMFVDAKHRLCRDVYGCRLAFGDFGKTWLAYRRKREEGPHA